VEYQKEDEAEEAMRELQDKNLSGLCIAIEWSKRSGKYDPKQSKRPPPK